MPDEVVVGGEALLFRDAAGSDLLAVPLRHAPALYAALHRYYGQRGVPTRDIYDLVGRPLYVLADYVDAAGAPVSLPLLRYVFDHCGVSPVLGIVSLGIWSWLHERVRRDDINLPGLYFDLGYDTIRFDRTEIVASHMVPADQMLLLSKPVDDELPAVVGAIIHCGV